MRETHEECRELLRIVQRISEKENLNYTLTMDSLIAYEEKIGFEELTPIIYITLAYSEFVVLKRELDDFCVSNEGYSVHDYSNTKQFDTFELWFVKRPSICFSDSRKADTFYYGTRMIIVPFFYVGDSEKQWRSAERYLRKTVSTLNARKLLPKKPLFSYIRLTPRRLHSNYYVRKRKKYTIQKVIERYGSKKTSRYIVCPQVIGIDKTNVNSVPRMVRFKEMSSLAEYWKNTKVVSFGGEKCRVLQEPQGVLKCYPIYFINSVVKQNKSQLEVNGGKFLWRVQQIQIELLREFDRICRKHGLRYNISFGTLLGAVRHKGFIPWDDDIDVTMPWEDYNKLDMIMEKELDSTLYYYRTPQNEKNNHLIFKHLERKNTLYTKSGRGKLENQIGVFIDIFPMYPSCNNMVLDYFHAKKCRYWRTALWATMGAETEKDPKKKKKYLRMSRKGNEYCYRKFIKWAMMFKNEKYLKFWIAMDRNPYKVPLVKMENYIDSIEIEFEGNYYKAPKNYREVLNYCFGKDWELYPTMRDRMPAHDAIMDIGNLYENGKDIKV